MKTIHPKSRSQVRVHPTKTFYVDLDMCGGELFLEDFDLEQFCQVLQRLVPGIRIVPVLDSTRHARNPNPTLVSQSVFDAAITKYCTACTLTGCSL